MRIYLNQNVYDAALDRIRYLFDEFEEVVAWISGGKDSTVIFHMVHKIAEEKGRLPLKVAFIDQEGEWEHTISYVRTIMDREDVNPYWFQMPLRLFNASSFTEDWLKCWNPDDEKMWMRKKEPNSITENKYGTDRFQKLFAAISKVEFPNKTVAHISGVRCEESPRRFIGLTASITYNHITWGSVMDKKVGHYTFYPLYDWSYTDIWKSINNNKWDYNKIYDYQFRYGMPIRDMRVSNLHHETSVRALFYLQEVEPNTYQKLTQRLKGIDTAGKMNKDDFFIYKLPYMFKTWGEYRDFLLIKLIQPEHHEALRKRFDKMDEEFGHFENYKNIQRQQVNVILANDWTGTKCDNIYQRYSTKITRARRDKMRELNGSK